MPELPEVEVTRRSFAAAIAGARIVSVWMGKPLRWPIGCALDSLVGRQVLGVRRRGKYLLIDLDQGMLLLHLGMSGSLAFAQVLAPRGVHDHFELQTSQGVLRLHDPRRFGAVVYAADEKDAPAHKLLGHWGMEPLSDDFTLAAFAAGLQASRSPIKQVLLAGRLVVGVGNIYASEALFLAGEKGGSTLRNFSSADGSAGHFQVSAHVYAREGLPCHTCRSLVKMLRQGQRSSFFCPTCQSA